MKKLLAIIILNLCFISSVQAGDIRDFQIEGISIGESLLDHYGEPTINNALDESHKDRQFITKTIYLKDSDIYEFIKFTYKKSDKKKKLHSVVAGKFFPNDIKKCKKEMRKIETELSLLFTSTIKKDWGKYKWSNGHYFPVTFDFKDSSRAMVACYVWTKKSGIKDSLKVSLYSSKYREYLNTQNQ